MQLESLRVELRPRSPWEAVELGTALVRMNAAAIWKPWLLLTVPVFAALTLAALALDRIWIAWLAMWWLKPLFDRIPLFVVSRAVFGDTPSTGETLAAQRNWGWRAMRQHLTWRRIGMTRALDLPVDLLEGADAPRLRQRRKVLGDSVRGHTALLTLVCLLFVLALTLSALALVLMFVPTEFLSESARAVWALLFDQPPPWAQFALHAVAWAATSLVEPFYVGAGFGLYLNRRTQIEAWDVEIAFRRLRARLASASTALLLVVALGPSLPLPSQAQERGQAGIEAPAQAGDDDADDRDATRIAEIFGDATVEDAAFGEAVVQAYEDPLLRPKRKEWQWQLRDPEDDRPAEFLPFPWLAKALGFVGEFGLWLLLGALAAWLAVTFRRWWPWLRGGARAEEAATPVETAGAVAPDALPDDVAAAARKLWREGRPRGALALLYRASVEAMTRRAGVMLVPGATESECLRASRRMPDPDDRAAFARVVRVWQYAAYARRLPAEDEFESLLAGLSQRFGWAA